MKHSFTFTLALALLVAGPSYAQSKQGQSSDKRTQQDELDPQLKRPQEPPRSDDSQRSAGESSSKDRNIDLSPPPNDAKDHPGSGGTPIEPANGVMEMKPWNPHQADKDIEVGLYYFKEKNYKAAESRYREALYWQDNNAEAHYRLGEVMEKTGRLEEARENFQVYLKVLPEGPLAKDAKKALDRIAKTEGVNAKKASTSRP